MNKHQHYIESIGNFVEQQTRRIFDTNEGKLKHFPKHVVWLVYFMAINVLAQGIMDIAIKVAGYTPWMKALAWRTDFLFLTAVSVLMGYQTLIGIRRRELDVTKNSVQVGLIVEIALFIGDILYVKEHQAAVPELLATRLPFIIFTFLNIIIILYLIHTLHLFKDEKGGWRIF
jgi:hypothetical protein